MRGRSHTFSGLIVVCLLGLLNLGRVSAQTNFFRGPDYLNTELTQEFQDRIFYLSSNYDTTSAGLNQYTYTLVAVNKHTGTKLGEIVLPVDSEVYAGQRNGLIAYLVDTQISKIHLIFVRTLDSSQHYSYKSAAYPEVIYYLQTDLDLNVTIPQKPILVNGGNRNFRIYFGSFVHKLGNDRLAYQYSVVDSTFLYTTLAYSMASKFLITDLTGNVTDDKFIGWQPPYHTQNTFWNHFTTSWLLCDSDTTYRLAGQFEDAPFSTSYGLMHWLKLDANLDLVHMNDTVPFPQSHFSRSDGAGTKLRAFGAGSVECQLIIPSGKIFRLGIGGYWDSSVSKDYFGPAVARVVPQEAYKIDTFYVVPQSRDNWDCPGYGASKQPMVFNPFDQRIYVYNVTNGGSPPGTGCGGPGEDAIGQLVCLDTNLVEQWVKYIPWKMGGTCMFPSGLGLPYQRGGVLITGTEIDKDDRYNLSKWHSYIYYADSSGKLGIGGDGGGPELLDRFSIYPNPAREAIIVRNMLPEAFGWVIYGVDGKQIKTGKGLLQKDNRIDISTMAEGIYLIRIQTEGGRAVNLKFIKK